MAKIKLIAVCFVIIILLATACACTKEEKPVPGDFEIPETPEDTTEYFFYEGKSNYVIVIADDALPAVKTASAELQNYLYKMTGYKLAVLSDLSREYEPRETEIVLGHTNRDTESLVKARVGLGQEGYTVLYEGKRIFISGGDEETVTNGRGTLYGTYDFLRLLGCGFYSVDTEIVPERQEIILDKTNVTEVPAFEYRDVFWTCAYDEVLSAKLHLNGGAMSGTDGRTISKKYGGAVTYAGAKFVHTFTYLVPADQYFEKHPEYFSEIDGVRTAKDLYSQLCLTNEDVYQIVLREVRNWLKTNPRATIVSVSQNDSYVLTSYCTCEECRKVDKEEGSPMGTLLRFINRLAEDIEKDYPNVAIDTLAYQHTLATPRKTKPRHNVIIRYCTGGCSLHNIEKCENNAGIAANIKNWGKICDRMYIWDYTTDFAEYLCPFVNFYTLQPNLQFFRDNGVKGVFEQGMYQSGESGEFGELRSYILARLLWNPDDDLDAIIDEFMNAYYGEAGPYIKEYIDTLYQSIKKKGRHMNLVANCESLYKTLGSETYNRLEELWTKAKEVTVGKMPFYTHVERSELSYRFMKQQLFLEEFDENHDEEAKKLADDCRRLGVTRISEGAMI